MKTRLPLIVGLVTLVFSSVAGASDTRRLTWPVPVEEVPREQFIRELSSMTLHGRVGDDHSVPDHVTGRCVDDAWVFEVKGAHGAETGFIVAVACGHIESFSRGMLVFDPGPPVLPGFGLPLSLRRFAKRIEKQLHAGQVA